MSATPNPPRSERATESPTPSREDLLRENERLRRELADRLQQLTEAERQIAELERQLALTRRDSRTSSKPPSSDGLQAAPRCRPRRRTRRPGGQPGHPGHHRPLVPADRVDHAVPLRPSECGCCHAALPLDLPPVGAPHRHQVIELPVIRAHVTEGSVARI